jgi:hypothetical protein
VIWCPVCSGGGAAPAPHGRPADEHRHRARGAADHDVLLRTRLQPDRVDEDVEERGRHGEAGGEEIRREREVHERDHVQHDAEDQRVRRHDLAGRQRPPFGAVHELIAVTLDPAVDRVRAAGRERTRDEHHDEQARGREPVRREQHRWNRRDEQQLDDAGFRESHVRPECSAPVGKRHAFGGGL